MPRFPQYKPVLHLAAAAILAAVLSVAMGAANLRAQMVPGIRVVGQAAEPARRRKTELEAMRSEVTVPRGEARIDGDLSEWPEKNWAAINSKCSFQMSWSDSRLCVAYRTDQPNLLRNSAAAADFSFAFTQGGGLDLMLRSAPPGTAAGASATQDRNPMPGDLRLFVTRRDGQTLAVLYRQKLSPASTGKDGKATPEIAKPSLPPWAR